VRQRRRKSDLCVDLKIGRRELTRKLDGLWRRAAQSRCGIDHDRKERDQKSHENFWKVAIAEPDQENRSKRDLRDRLRHENERIDRVAERLRVHNGNCEWNAKEDRQRKSQHGLIERDPGMKEDVRTPLDRCRNDLRWSGNEPYRDVE
jgi:hypothetical protein